MMIDATLVKATVIKPILAQAIARVLDLESHSYNRFQVLVLLKMPGLGSHLLDMP